MLDYALVRAVAAVIRTGSFDKAARELHVTPSAVSQRVKQLEERLGTILVVRGQPCAGTPAGSRLSRHVAEVGLLEHALHSELGGLMPSGPAATVRIAINADSLATWFVDAMADVDGLLFDLVLDDQDHSLDWLRRGEVSAAVTAQTGTVSGCDSRPLGALRYIATASPSFIDRWFAGGVDADSLACAPCMTFNAKDRLQAGWVASVLGDRIPQRMAQEIAMPTHWLPSSHAFVDAALAGIGWGMSPESLAAPHLQAGRLVPLVPGRPLDVALVWQWSRMLAPALGAVTASVLRAARQHLKEAA